MSVVSKVLDLSQRVATEFNTVRTQLAGKSDVGHKHAAADLTSGILAVVRGGTGIGTVGAARTVAVSDGTKMSYTGAPGSGTGQVLENQYLGPGWTARIRDVLRRRLARSTLTSSR